MLGEKPSPTVAKPKASFLQYKPAWQNERVGDYVGKKIPSLLEFLENKIHMRELMGTSKVQSSGNGPQPKPHRLAKKLIQEELLGTIMK